MKILKIWSKELIFHNFSQNMSNCCLLRILFILKKCKKHENIENMVKQAHIFIIFHKLCQTAAFWGRFVAWENVKEYENMVKQFHITCVTCCVRLLLFEVVTWLERTEKTWKCSKYGEKHIFSSFFTGYVKLLVFEVVI